ncbi:SOS response-associated peptidase [Mesorhizobium sp. BR1-1-14]|uniref:SOS response-associated peptidase n=1 Tax=Mesorhizobium sp. BR1-1-14 TaxID=2876655 RepID=UPI0021E1BF54|nr:SOS response-associated peptidase [Mesorhizobium sp. BR1-1-14]
MQQIHDRQPVILYPALYDAWLDPETPTAAAKGLLLAPSTATCNSIASAAVNSVKTMTANASSR